MSDRDWSIRLAVIGACLALAFFASWTGLLVGLSQASHERENAEAAANCGPDSKERCPSQIDRDRAGLPYVAERIASGSDPQSTDEREKRDLAAQESMSVWAFWMLIASAASVVVTMIGTCFLLWQIMLTREAVKDTGDATKAMMRQNEIAEAGQRPWLDVRIELEGISRSARGYVLRVKLIIENVGNTPANQLRYGMDGWFYEDFPKETPFSEIQARLDQCVKEAAERAFTSVLQKTKEGITVFPRSIAPIYYEEEIETDTSRVVIGPIAWLAVALRYSFGGGEGSTVRIFNVRSFGLDVEDESKSIGEYPFSFTGTDAKIVDWEIGGHAI